ncbi:MAG: single-stranded-DNA-specific exonuclease RecJ [Bdellovibrionia bacterium]
MGHPLWVPRSQPLEMVEGPFPPLIGKLLASRGILDKTQVEKTLNPKLGDLKDPLSLFGMDIALERILKAYHNDEKICIYADFDLDGTSGLALLLAGLEALGFKNVLSYQPKRLSEGYGFHKSAVEDLKERGVSLIITVDVGITAVEAVARANELGVDVIITDHHLPGEKLPEALVIVNPNQPQCQSQLGYLCGAGVAFYLLRGLKRALVEAGVASAQNFDLKEVLDFFTIGTLTDMVPLVDDNRVLVKHGLVKLAETKRAGLRALLNSLGFSGRTLTSQDVAIKFAPKLNALSRMEAGVLPIDIFLEKSATRAEELVHFVLDQNSQRVKFQSDAESRAMELLKDWSHQDFVFVVSEEFHRGVLGLIATKLSQNFNRPAFVGSVNAEGVVVGSARLPNGMESCLVTALTSAEHALTRFGGHAAAAGFEFHLHAQNQVMESLAKHFSETKEQDRPLKIEYDIEASLADINKQTMTWHDFVGPFGTGFQIPLFKFKRVQLLSKKELKGGHYRLKLSSDNPSQDSSVEALLFTPTHRQLQELRRGETFDLLGEMQWNYFAGAKTIQLLVRDLKVAEENS